MMGNIEPQIPVVVLSILTMSFNKQSRSRVDFCINDIENASEMEKNY